MPCRGVVQDGGGGRRGWGVNRLRLEMEEREGGVKYARLPREAAVPRVSAWARHFLLRSCLLPLVDPRGSGSKRGCLLLSTAALVGSGQFILHEQIMHPSLQRNILFVDRLLLLLSSAVAWEYSGDTVLLAKHTRWVRSSMPESCVSYF